MRDGVILWEEERDDVAEREGVGARVRGDCVPVPEPGGDTVGVVLGSVPEGVTLNETDGEPEVEGVTETEIVEDGEPEVEGVCVTALVCSAVNVPVEERDTVRVRVAERVCVRVRVPEEDSLPDELLLPLPLELREAVGDKL